MWGDDTLPFYAWFIKRNSSGKRLIIFEHWVRLLFRDYLTTHPDVAGKYQKLKTHLAAEYPNDRMAHTKGKMALSCR